MRAVRYMSVGEKPRVTDVEVPEPGPGQLLLKVTAAGLCHSDLAVMSWPADGFPYELPMTLGHEGAGRVESVGPGVSRVSVGESVVVYGPWGCGVCRMCAQGRENYCPHAARLGVFPPGLGSQGALAEYVLIDSERHVVPIGDLDPVQTVPLTDAGLTPYHAIKRSLDRLVAGSVTVVIGVGGLGHIAVQLLRRLSAATVVALDVREESLELARRSGAQHTLPSDESALEAVRDLSRGLGAAAVFDFVGAAATTALARRMVGQDGDLALVGIGGGTVEVGFESVPFGSRTGITYWGTRSELIELIDLARQGVLDVHVERYGIESGPEAYERMEAGLVKGRAVVVP
ncbi:alcohol dehydrogenase [Streptomonospora alba]|uniref:alcohol dehydrogenase n=1 Tax=Streptomonospora alba TaxID=183763 RepID=A0A0C2JI21_9ACTN|nr:NAD(P)-dependent alcohol dehydrogenase [Streptomonospora alba]KIH96607.1 alcohol dehydrogenase [Streptomonospora alba]